MKLTLENGFNAETSDPAAIRAALQSLNTDGNSFAILTSGDDRYLQTAAEEDGFIVERRDGSYNAHFYAGRPGLHPPLQDQSWLVPRADLGQDRFTLDEVIDIFSAYVAGTTPGVSVQWVRMDMPDPAALSTKVSTWSRIAVWTILAAAVFGAIRWLRF